MRGFLITLTKVGAWIVFAAVMALVIIFVGVFNFGFLEFGINRQLNEMVGKNTPLEVSIGTIEGDFFNTLHITDVSIRYTTDSSSYPIAEIPSIRASYSLADIWRGRFDINVLGIDSARFTIRQDSTGEWLLPKPQSPTTSPGTKIPEFSASLVSLTNASIRVFGRDSTWNIDSLNLTAGVVSADGAYALDLRSFGFVSDFRKTHLRSASGKITYSNNRLVFKDLSVALPTIGVAGDGWIVLPDSARELSGQITLDTLHADMEYLGDFFGKHFTGKLGVNGSLELGDSEIYGALTIQGGFQGRTFESLHTKIRYRENTLSADTVYGVILGGCSVAGKFELDLANPDIAYQFEGVIDSLNVANIANGAMTTAISGKVKLDGSGLTGASMKIHTDVELGESFMDIFHVHSASGELDIYTDSLRLEPGFGVSYYENSFSASGLILFSGPIDIRGAAELQRLSRFEGQTFIEELGGRGQATFSLNGTATDPDISGKFYSDSVWFYQMYAERAWYEFDVQRFLTRRSGNISVRLGAVDAWEFPLDSISAEMRIDSNMLYFDTLTAFSGEAQLSTAATVDYLAEPQPIKMFDVTLAFRSNSYHERDTALLLFDTTGIEFVKAEFASSRTRTGANGSYESFSFRGRAGFDNNLTFDLDLNNIDLAPWMRLLPNAPAVSGRLSVAGDMTANGDTLRFDAEGQIDSLVYQELYIGDIASDFRYADKTLTIDTMYLHTSGGEHSLHGTIPLDIRFGAEADTLFPGPQRLEAHSSETSYEFVSYFLPQIEDLSGKLEIDATISGTPLHPAFDGAGKLSDGALKIYELEIPAESLNVAFTMQDRLITITDGACRFPPKVRKNGKNKKYSTQEYGYVTITSGSLEILSIDSIDYDIDLEATNFPFRYTLGAIKGKANARIRVAGVTPPKITGEINLISALYEDEFLEEDAGYLLLTQFERPDSWDIDVNVSIISNAVMRNSELDAEFKGTARAIRTDGLWSYLYNLEVIRGRVFLTTSSFRLDPAGTVINDDVAVNNPLLNLIARTKVRVPNPSAPGETSTGTRQVEAAISVTGTLDEPIISYYDDPSVSDNDKINEDQLYTLLAFGYQVGRADQNQTTMLGNRGAEMLATYLSSNLTRAGARSIGVETFEIDPSADVEQTEVTLGLYVLPGLYTYGKSDIAATGQEVGFEYYLGKHLLIQGKRDENDQYFLFLNLGWDY